MNGLCYLDNSATTRPFDEVRAAMAQAMDEDYFNPSAAYPQAAAVRARVEAARAAVTGALAGGRVVFTSGGTEGDHLALAGALSGRRRGVVTTAAEHPAVLRTAEALGEAGASVTVLPVDDTGAVRPDALADALSPDTAVVSLMHVNNETGAVHDLPALAALIHAHAPEALFHVDGVQAFLRLPAEPARWGVDLYTVSAHKIHGPKGVGALWVGGRARLQTQLPGGGQEEGLRSGTENVPGIVGFGRAVEVYSQDLLGKRDRLMALKLALWAGLSTLDGVRVNGPAPAQGAPHILNVSFDGVRGAVLLRSLAEQGVLVGTGSACGTHKNAVSPVLTAMGLPKARAEGAIRFSLSIQNTEEDVARACEVVREQVTRLRRFQRR